MIPPKSVRSLHNDGKMNRTIEGPNHQMCTIYPPTECRVFNVQIKEDFFQKESNKKQGFKVEKRAYLQAKAAYCASMNETTNQENLKPWMMKIPMFHYQHILQKQVIFLNVKCVRNGDQYYLMQPICSGVTC
jgi:hypothetical protein